MKTKLINPPPGVTAELPTRSATNMHPAKSRKSVMENEPADEADTAGFEQSLVDLSEAGPEVQANMSFQIYAELEDFTVAELLRLNFETNTRAVTDQDMAYADSLMKSLNAFPRS